MKLFIILGTVVGFATAACPNSCSGHGTCDIYDACTCFKETSLELVPDVAPVLPDTGAEGFVWDKDTHPQLWQTKYVGGTIEVEWTGADCSRRTCARGISWSQSCTAAGCDSKCQHQAEKECSDQGICDRATGLCSCFPGYSGSSCQRTVCPNDCSGHGTCRSNRDFAYDWAVAKSKQLHPTTDNDNIQNRFEDTYFASYDDAWDSGKHYGCLCDIGYRGPSCALVECPSAQDPLDDKCDKVNDQDVTDYQLQYDAPFGAAGWELAYSGRGGDVYPTGPQNDLGGSDFDEEYHLDENGRKVYSCYGNDSGQDCSGRGICDYSSGDCKCFSGYAGTACESVESMA